MRVCIVEKIVITGDFEKKTVGEVKFR